MLLLSILKRPMNVGEYICQRSFEDMEIDNTVHYFVNLKQGHYQVMPCKAFRTRFFKALPTCPVVSEMSDISFISLKNHLECQKLRLKFTQLVWDQFLHFNCLHIKAHLKSKTQQRGRPSI